MRLVITATGDVEVDAAVSRPRALGGSGPTPPINPSTASSSCPRSPRSGRVTVAVSTDGASPALAKALRDRIATMLGDEVAALAEELAEARAAVKAGGGSTEDVDWSAMIGRVLGDVDTE